MALFFNNKIINITKREKINSVMIFCLNFFHSFKTKSKLESHKKVHEDEKFCKNGILSKDTKIINFIQQHESGKKAAIIFVNDYCGSLILKKDGSKSNLKKTVYNESS